MSHSAKDQRAGGSRATATGAIGPKTAPSQPQSLTERPRRSAIQPERQMHTTPKDNKTAAKIMFDPPLSCISSAQNNPSNFNVNKNARKSKLSFRPKAPNRRQMDPLPCAGSRTH